jgi:crotonobetainyl-CoA:carnitine CoA-transferase CaiB-like acyl-CoA transferase
MDSSRSAFLSPAGQARKPHRADGAGREGAGVAAMGPLSGISVVELAGFIVGPSAAAVLADWGADVVKIESPEGDPSRGWPGDLNPWFELDNRGKRSITLDLKTTSGQQIADELLANADIFVTNLRIPALEALGLDYGSLEPRFPQLIYLSITGFGLAGPDRDRAAYDAGAFWSRSGAMLAMTPEGADLPNPAGGTGDHMTAMAAVAGATAALMARTRTGLGQHVTTSLLRAGMFMIGCDMASALRLGNVTPPRSRKDAHNPLYNTYRTKDGRWLFLLGLQPQRHLASIANAVGVPRLADDPRFSSFEALAEHRAELLELLNQAFLSKSFNEWERDLDANGVWWTPVRAPMDTLTDSQVQAAGAFVDSPVTDGTVQAIASPVDFLGTPWSIDKRAPEAGEHTEEILLSLGYTWESIGTLQEAGVFG